ncbi:hypothetical protein [Natrialba hulunbeirensis]
MGLEVDIGLPLVGVAKKDVAGRVVQPSSSSNPSDAPSSQPVAASSPVK